MLNKSRSFKYSAARLESLAEAVDRCRAKAAARMRLYTWLVFNLLVGNGDNHLKNISFLVEAAGIRVAPAYDLLCTAVYDTRELATERGHWPASPLAVPIGDAKMFAAVTRQHVMAAAGALGLAEATAARQLDRLIKAVPLAVHKLYADVEAGLEKDVALSPNPDIARNHVGGELHMLRAVRHIVVPEMVARLA